MATREPTVGELVIFAVAVFALLLASLPALDREASYAQAQDEARREQMTER